VWNEPLGDGVAADFRAALKALKASEADADKRYMAWCYAVAAGAASGPKVLANFQFDPAVGSGSIRISPDGRKVWTVWVCGRGCGGLAGRGLRAVYNE
jgi:hypothetical protein